MNYFEETKRLLDKSNFYYIITTDMQGRYSYVNTHYAQAFSHISDSIVGQPYQITMCPDDINTCIEVSAKCFQHPDKMFPATIRKHDGKGGYIITQWEYKAMFDENKEPAGVFCLGYDITQSTVEKKQLESAQQEIENKSDILRKIAFQQSHVIRAPLANILGLTAILDKMETDSNIVNICKMIVESSKQLDLVIRDIVNDTYV